MRRFNDRTAKRLGKKQFTTNIVSPMLYEKWKKENPEYSLSVKEFNAIWNIITEAIQNTISTNPQGIKLPFHCGEVAVRYLPPTMKFQDQATSNEIGESIPHLNITSKGKVAKISWVRKMAARFNPHIMLFGFKHTRKIADKTNETITNKPEIFRSANIKTYDKSGDNL